jgi:hypothetical protein
MSTQDPVQLRWFKSSYSGGDGGECVEVAADPTTLHVRDSKEHGSPQLAFASAAWSGFLVDVRRRNPSN